jgi:crotonobetainyl-CoA:carnitine CoA-transferase CaiB-like acyl-CoA transferase
MTETRAEPCSSDLTTLDLADSSLYRGGFPQAVFTRLRREAPVWWHAAPAGYAGADQGFWALSKYEDVQAANRDTELFSALDGPALADRPEMRGTMLVSMDGREHGRQRRLISAGFTPRMVGRLEEPMRRWAASIVDAALARGTCDFVQDVAYQLPMHMIADVVGIPVEDRRWLFTLTNDFLAAGFASVGPVCVTRSRDSLPLTGLRILDMTGWWAGPVATHLLATLGAEVIHVESVGRPDGVRMVGSLMAASYEQWWEACPHFLHANSNKLGVTLDLDHATGRELLERLIRRCDAVVENFTPRVLGSFGLGRARMQELNPAAILVRMPAFGLSGPWRDHPGFAQTMEQLSGLAWATGHPDDPPRIPRGPCDHPCAGGQPGMERWLALSVADDAQWRALRSALGNPDWAMDAALDTREGRRAAHDAVDERLCEWTRTRERAELALELRALGIPASEVADPRALGARGSCARSRGRDRHASPGPVTDDERARGGPQTTRRGT